MPYVTVGNCVHKQAADGSAGEKMHCYDNPEDAKKYMRALYANVKTSEIVEMSMRIEKASFDKENQIMRWRAVASDTGMDLYDEAMSPELYKDFVDRINNNTPVPEPFKSVICEDSWCGGKPYISLAHYKAGTSARNVPGQIEETFVDGTYLKSKGTLNNDPLGLAVFDALNKDLYTKKSDGTPEIPPEQRIRISIGFLDLQHKHILDDGTEKVFDRTDLNQVCQLCSTGIGRKIYTKGQLVHEALTRVPVNPRTSMEVDKSMDIKTKKDDAASIIGEALVEELEAKSLAEDVLVIKADGSTSPQPMDIPDDMDKCYDPDTGGYDQECVDNLMMGNHLPANRKAMKKDLEKSDTVSLSVTKSESWGDEPASSYLVVGDSEHPTTWHLPVKKSGKVDTGLMGAAKAALTSNHRGKAYAGPNKAKALAKLKSLYNSHGQAWEDKSGTEELMSQTGKVKEWTDEDTDVKPRKMGIAGFDDEADLNNSASDEEMGQKKSKVVKAKKPMVDEQAEGESPAEEKKEGKKGEKAEEKALTSAFDAVAAKVMELRSLGITGKAAEPYLQPLLNKAAGAVEEALTPDGSLGYSPDALAEIMRSAVMEAISPIAQEVAAIKAQLRSNPTGGPIQSSVPSPRGLKFSMTQRSDVSPATGQPVKQLSQIEKIARASTGRL